MPNEGWHSLGSLDDLWEGDMQGHRVGDHELVVIRVDGGDVHVYQGICPHQEQRLAEGDFDGNAITCFGHMWQFDPLSGVGINPTGCQLARYPVDVVDGNVLVKTDGVTPNYSF